MSFVNYIAIFHSSIGGRAKARGASRPAV